MILDKLGTNLKKNTKNKVWWVKLGIAIILSNIFFFVLVGGDSNETKSISDIPEGWVEVQLSAELMTPFHSGKKVLIIHRIGRKKVEGVLKVTSVDQLGKITVLVKESEAHSLFQFENWEVLPYLKNLSFVTVKKDANHEIRY